MVEAGTTLGSVEDTSVVVHEVSVLSVDGNAGWASLDGSLELVDALWWNGVVRLDEDLSLGGVVFARAGLRNVWVVRLKLLAVGLQIVEGVDLKTSIATRRFWITINKLGLGELQELSSSNEMSSLNCSG